MPPVAVALALTVVFALGVIAGMVLLALTAARVTHRPPRLEIRDGTFVVPPHRRTYILRFVATFAAAGLRSGRRRVTWTALVERRPPYWAPVAGYFRAGTVQAYATDPRYVAAVIEYYRQVPDSRQHIGDPTELARIYAVVTGAAGRAARRSASGG